MHPLISSSHTDLVCFFLHLRAMHSKAQALHSLSWCRPTIHVLLCISLGTKHCWLLVMLSHKVRSYAQEKSSELRPWMGRKLLSQGKGFVHPNALETFLPYKLFCTMSFFSANLILTRMLLHCSYMHLCLTPKGMLWDRWGCKWSWQIGDIWRAEEESGLGRHILMFWVWGSGHQPKALVFHELGINSWFSHATPLTNVKILCCNWWMIYYRYLHNHNLEYICNTYIFTMSNCFHSHNGHFCVFPL